MNQATLKISVVVPAYNEQNRLPLAIKDMLSFFEHNPYDYEIIVVSDGSTDNTDQVVRDLNNTNSKIKLLTYFPNRGKGHAVKTGMLAATGDIRMFADADGATPFQEFDKLYEQIQAGYDIAIASRAYPSDKTKIKTKLHRKIIGRIFNFFLNNLLIRGIFDSQCGFKMFTKDSAIKLFPLQKSQQFSFDYELLYLAKIYNLKVKEVAVNWTNVDGSKVNLVLDSSKMFLDIFKIRYWHRTFLK